MMTLLVIILLAGVTLLSRVEKTMCDAFSGDWLRFDDDPTERERLEMDNSEFDWGHNIKNYMEE